MWASRKSRWSYKVIRDEENDNDSGQIPETARYIQKGSPKLLAIFMLIGVVAGITIGYSIQDNLRLRLTTLFQSDTHPYCYQPATRREWRSLSRLEKQNYISAVQCLATKPSKVRNNGTLYDDFPWIHRHYGESAHGAASFLSWHRYFIHIYEKTLREECGYQDHLAYWDWTLDWESLHLSPVFNPITGFGGDGDPEGEITIGSGRCLTDGPFAELRPLFYNAEDHPHCLSRGFWDGERNGFLPGEEVSPTMVEKILAQPDYEAFFLALEHGPHNAIPNSVRGDFLKFTAPSDPLFFLHHTQLDRLWWMWQNIYPSKRLNEYSGNATHNSAERAQLSDMLRMGGLAPDVEVKKVMDSRRHDLCYLY